MARTFTANGNDYNDRATWFLVAFNPGFPQVQFDTRRSYDGRVRQVNVRRPGLIQMSATLRLEAASAAARDAALDALALDVAAGSVIVYGDGGDTEVYALAESDAPVYQRDASFVALFIASVTLSLWRLA